MERNERVLVSSIIVLVIIGGLLVISSEVAGSRQAPVGLSNTICLKCHPEIKTLGDWESGVVFSHRSHLPRIQRCTDCHRGVGHKGEGILPEMSDCVKCHDGRKVSDACDLCHEKREFKVYPKVHIDLDLANKGNCFSCHLGAFCMDCHDLEMPHPADFAKEHYNELKIRGAAVCSRCHENDLGSPQGCFGGECHRYQ